MRVCVCVIAMWWFEKSMVVAYLTCMMYMFVCVSVCVCVCVIAMWWFENLMVVAYLMCMMYMFVCASVCVCVS